VLGTRGGEESKKQDRPLPSTFKKKEGKQREKLKVTGIIRKKNPAKRHDKGRTLRTRKPAIMHWPRGEERRDRGEIVVKVERKVKREL